MTGPRHATPDLLWNGTCDHSWPSGIMWRYEYVVSKRFKSKLPKITFDFDYFDLTKVYLRDISGVTSSLILVTVTRDWWPYWFQYDLDLGKSLCDWSLKISLPAQQHYGQAFKTDWFRSMLLIYSSKLRYEDRAVPWYRDHTILQILQILQTILFRPL